MKKFSINCDFGGQMAPFDIFIGQPESSHHPLHFQADWLQKQRGGTVPPDVMQAILELNKLAIENGVPLEDLCVYALGSAQEENDSSASHNSELSDKPDDVAEHQEYNALEEPRSGEQNQVPEEIDQEELSDNLEHQEDNYLEEPRGDEQNQVSQEIDQEELSDNLEHQEDNYLEEPRGNEQNQIPEETNQQEPVLNAPNNVKSEDENKQ